MDIVLIVLRLVHIVASVAWIALGASMVLIIVPVVGRAGDSGFRFLKALLTRTAYPRAFPVAAGLTILAGILLYAVGDSASHFSRLGNAALGTGALAGLLAGIHGGIVTGRSTNAMIESLSQNISDNGQNIPANALTILRERTQKLAGHSRISFILMVIALLGMGTARYL